MPNGWGVHFWMTTPRTLFVRFTKRGSRRYTSAVSSKRIAPHKWQYVATTYNHKTGVAKLYLNSRVIAYRRIGRIKLATNYPVRMGAKIGDRRYFKGRVSCVHVYDVALNGNQIARRKRRCFRKCKGNVLSRHFNCVITVNTLLTECEVRTVSNVPSFFPLPYGPSAAHKKVKKPRIHNLWYGPSKRGNNMFIIWQFSNCTEFFSTSLWP
jgi:hypothetical protein